MKRNQPLEPETFDPVAADPVDLTALHHFHDRVRAELDPEDQATSPNATIRSYRSIAALSDVDVHIWLVRAESAIVALATAEIWHRPDNPHALQLSPLSVLPEYRRQGLGTELLARILELARKNDKSLLLNTTDSRVPAGEAFARAIGAEPGGQGKVYELDLAAANLQELRAIEVAARKRAPEYEVAMWGGHYPGAELENVALVRRAMNTRPPSGIDIDLTERVVTVQQLLDEEAYLFSSGRERRTVYVRHKRTNELAGFSELTWDVESPATLHQGETGVLPEHRGHGLGLWMKAHMLTSVLHGLAGARKIRSGTAESNEPMKRINRKLGFTEKWSDTEWQARTTTVQKYLDDRRARRIGR